MTEAMREEAKKAVWNVRCLGVEECWRQRRSSMYTCATTMALQSTGTLAYQGHQLPQRWTSALIAGAS